MKKTLFLALALGITSAATAEVNASYETAVKGDKGQNLILIKGSGEITQEHINGETSYAHVGYYNGDADVTLAADNTLTLAEGLYIGGVGYGLSGKDYAGNGVLRMESGSTLVIGAKTPTSARAHVNVGNSQLVGPCRGELYMDNATFSACQLTIGIGKGSGYMEMTNGSVVTLTKSVNDKSWSGSQTGLLIGSGEINKGNCGTGTLILNDSQFYDYTTDNLSCIGLYGTGTLALQNNSSFYADGYYCFGDYYGKGLSKADISIDSTSTMDMYALDVMANATLRNEGNLFVLYFDTYEGSNTIVEKDATLMTYASTLGDGATLINRGTLSHYIDSQGAYESNIYLYGGSRLQTGEVCISGCEGQAAEGHKLITDYSNTGLGKYMLLQYGAEEEDPDSGTITLGALLTGMNEMQFLSAGDMQSINNKVLYELHLAKTDENNTPLSDENGNYLPGNEYGNYTIAYKHEIGKYITVNYTTDHLNTVNGTENIAVNGGAILVEQGDGEHHIGTIGSYEQDTTETAAAIAMHEQTAGSKVTWEGTELQTVMGETTLIATGNQVKVTPAEGAGTLTVVEGSTLNNQGAVQTDEVIVNGTLDNNGTIAAATTVEAGGTLKGSGTLGDTTVQSGGSMVVGNSPGAPTIEGNLVLDSDSLTVFSVAGVKTPSGKKLTGWDSASYSQITITNEGVLTLDGGAEFRIEFGGSILNAANEGKPLEFDMTLVTAAPGKINLNEAALTDLLAHTEFLISQEEGANGSGWSISTKDVSYYVAGDGSALHLKGGVTLSNPAVPEPATATLSLLALAALAARRRRH